jgi:hypothetical protein
VAASPRSRNARANSNLDADEIEEQAPAPVISRRPSARVPRVHPEEEQPPARTLSRKVSRGDGGKGLQNLAYILAPAAMHPKRPKYPSTKTRGNGFRGKRFRLPPQADSRMIERPPFCRTSLNGSMKLRVGSTSLFADPTDFQS